MFKRTWIAHYTNCITQSLTPTCIAAACYDTCLVDEAKLQDRYKKGAVACFCESYQVAILRIYLITFEKKHCSVEATHTALLFA